MLARQCTGEWVGRSAHGSRDAGRWCRRERKVEKGPLSEIHSIADLTPDLQNARSHNPRNLGMIRTALGEVGAARSIVIDENGVILAGNGVIEAAADAGIERVQVVDADGETIIAVRRRNLTPEQKKKLALFDNRAGELATWDATQIAAELEAGLDLSVLFYEDELSAILEAAADDLLGATAAQDAPEAQVNRAAELQAKWQTATGQLWEIPSQTFAGKCHRLLCGDSTKAEAVQRLMGGEKAEMVWTDPPYGVAVGDKNKFLNSIAPSNRVEENLTNDTLAEPELEQMLERAFDLAIEHCLAGAAWYVAAPPGPLHVLFGQVLKDRGIWRQTIQWVKNNATFAPLGVDYHWRSEPIFYGWVPNAAHRYYGGRKQDTVWEIDRPSKSPEHPTMKPVELITRAIENSSLHGLIVYDPFAGSGTTIIASEQVGRLGAGMEISDKYIAVCLERLVQMGLAPRLVE